MTDVSSAQTGATTAVVRSVQALVLLLGVAGLLRLLDWGPRAAARDGYLRDLPTIEAVERAAGRRLALPAWFPASLPWPPARVRVLGVVPQVVALDIGPADGGTPLLVLAQSVREPVPLPPSFFPPGLLLERRTIAWRAGDAQLTRFRAANGATWVELAWEQDGQAFAFRTRGSLEQLLDLAASVRREGGR